MPSVSLSVNTYGGQGGLWCHAFQNANTQWLGIFEKRIIAGNFFLGLQAHNVQIFDANIPPRSTIQSAVMRVTAFSSASSVRSVNINTPNRFDGSLLRRPLLRPLTHFTGWRPDRWSNADMRLDSNTATLIVETSAGVNNRAWIFRQIQAGTSPLGVPPTPGSGHRDRMAQRFTMPVVGNSTIGSVTLQLYRANNPAGSVRVQVMAAVLDSDGVTLVPSETILATSGDVLMSTIPTSTAGSPIVFSFTGANQIALVAGLEYFLVVLPDAYTINNFDVIVMRHQNQFFTTGKLMHFGEGLGCDWQNMPGTAEVYNAATPPGSKLATNILWDIPAFSIGVSVFTPDITALVQEQVNHPNYNQTDRAIIISTGETGGGMSNRIWRSNGHVSNLPPRLDVTYTPPPTSGKAHLSEVLTGSARLTDGGARAELSEVLTGSARLTEGGARAELSEVLTGSAKLSEDC